MQRLGICIDSGRFVLLKDVSCDLATVKRRVALAAGSSLAIVNANAAIAYDAMLAGARGFTGVFTNFHPDLYQWLRTSSAQHPELATEVNTFLVIAAVSEALGYPAFAKLYHQRIGTFDSIRSRAVDVRSARKILGARRGARQDHRWHRGHASQDRACAGLTWRASSPFHEED